MLDVGCWILHFFVVHDSAFLKNSSRNICISQNLFVILQSYNYEESNKDQKLESPAHHDDDRYRHDVVV